MEIAIVLILIILNGIFAMSEISIISSRKSKLQQQSASGNKGARKALELSKNPNKFLSTVQIGITLVGIFAGAFGGATIAGGLSAELSKIQFLDPYSDAIGIAVVVIVITYLSLIIGELVPKRIALNNPEKIAMLVARPMDMISTISAPFVYLLSVSTDLILRMLQIKQANEQGVSIEEIRLLIREGAKAGVFEKSEKDIVERTLKLGDKKANTLMTPKKDVIWLDIDSAFKVIRNKIIKSKHSHYPVCNGGLDKVIGVIRTEEILAFFLKEKKIDLEKFIHKPLFIPEGIDGIEVLELFKKSGVHMAIVIDEYGNIQGILTLADILEAIVGDIPTANEFKEKEILKREDGTYLIDGLVSIDEFKEFFHLKKLPDEKLGIFHTVGGFVMHTIGRIPVLGDHFRFDDFRLEIVDMDGNRVDKILATVIKKKKRLL